MRVRQEGKLFGLVVALLAAPSVAAGEKMALSISPPVMEMVVAPGGDRSFQVTLTNDGDKTFEATGQVADLVLDQEGNPVPEPAGTSAWSASSWVTLVDGDVTLGPGEQKTVRCRVRVPRGQTGGRYGVVLFTARRGVHPPGTGMRLETRTGTVLLLTAARTERKRGEVSDFDVRREKEEDLLFEIGLRNTGNVHFRASGEVVVRDATDRVAARLELEGGTGTVLPEGTRNFTARLSRPRLEPGSYRADVRFNARGLRTVSARHEFEVGEEGEVSVRPAGPDAAQ